MRFMDSNISIHYPLLRQLLSCHIIFQYWYCFGNFMRKSLKISKAVLLWTECSVHVFIRIAPCWRHILTSSYDRYTYMIDQVKLHIKDGRCRIFSKYLSGFCVIFSMKDIQHFHSVMEENISMFSFEQLFTIISLPCYPALKLVTHMF